MTLEHRINKVLRRVKNPKKRKALKEGIKAGAEHSKTIRWIRANPEASVDEALKRIAQDHIEENGPDYYSKLKATEQIKKKVHHKLKSPRLALIGRPKNMVLFFGEPPKTQTIWEVFLSVTAERFF